MMIPSSRKRVVVCRQEAIYSCLLLGNLVFISSKLHVCPSSKPPPRRAPYTPRNFVTGANLKPLECLWRKAEVDLGEKQDSFRRTYGWFWAQLGMDLGKRLDVARSGLLICFN
jgi:hypothetical protein